jgi:hypothetical protein
MVGLANPKNASTTRPKVKIEVEIYQWEGQALHAEKVLLHCNDAIDYTRRNRNQSQWPAW